MFVDLEQKAANLGPLPAMSRLSAQRLVEMFEVSPVARRPANKYFLGRKIVKRCQLGRRWSRHHDLFDPAEKRFTEIDLLQAFRSDRQDAVRDVAAAFQESRDQQVLPRLDNRDMNTDVLSLRLVMFVDFLFEGLEEFIFRARLPGPIEPVCRA